MAFLTGVYDLRVLDCSFEASLAKNVSEIVRFSRQSSLEEINGSLQKIDVIATHKQIRNISTPDLVRLIYGNSLIDKKTIRCSNRNCGSFSRMDGFNADYSHQPADLFSPYNLEWEMGGGGRMRKTPLGLQGLRRWIYLKTKSEKS